MPKKSSGHAGIDKKSDGEAPADAIAMLVADHKSVAQMFGDFKKLVKSESSGAQRQEAARQICAALTIHAIVEEEIFYPAAREILEDKALVDEAEVEHSSAKALIEKIQGMGPEEPKYDAHVIVLNEYVEHHVKEEEGEMFPQVKRSKALDLMDLGDRMRARKTELIAQNGPAKPGAKDKAQKSR